MAADGKPTAVMLCGGRSVRFGGDKAQAVVGGLPVIERVAAILKPLAGNIIAVTSPDNAGVRVSGDVSVVIDALPGSGPLGGIYTGLLHARSDLIIAVACDMPFLNSGVLKLMLERADGFDAVVPRLSGKYIEPLHAVYAKSCLPKIEASLAARRKPVWQAIKELNTRYLEKHDYLKIDPRMLSFFNINTFEDLERANRIASRLNAFNAALT